MKVGGRYQIIKKVAWWASSCVWGVLLAGCIDIPTPEVTIDIYLPEIIETCVVETGLTESQCLYMICSDIIQEVDGEEVPNSDN